VILNPDYMDVIEWTDRMSEFFEIGGGTTSKLNDPDKWQAWAVNLIGNPDEIGRDAPNPFQFNDWRKWAYAFFLTQELN